MNTSRIDFAVELTFDGWTYPHDMDCIVHWDNDEGDETTPAFCSVGKVECQDDAATVFASVVESWMEEFPDTPCPFHIADVAQALKDATDQVADNVTLSDLEDE